MPRLLVFVPCRRVIVDEEDKTISLISLFDRVRIETPPGDPEIPSGTLAPIEWAIYSWWSAAPEDMGVGFEQQVNMFSPEGEKVGETNNRFVFTAERHRLTLKSPGFPVHTPGIWNLKLLLRREEEEWQEIATYPMTVEYIQAEQHEEE